MRRERIINRNLKIFTPRRNIPSINQRLHSNYAKMLIEIQNLKKRISALEDLKQNKTLTEEVVEHFITPAGLKAIYKFVPYSSDAIKEVDILIDDVQNTIIDGSYDNKLVKRARKITNLIPQTEIRSKKQ